MSDNSSEKMVNEGVENSEISKKYIISHEDYLIIKSYMSMMLTLIKMEQNKTEYDRANELLIEKIINDMKCIDDVTEGKEVKQEEQVQEQEHVQEEAQQEEEEHEEVQQEEKEDQESDDKEKEEGQQEDDDEEEERKRRFNRIVFEAIIKQKHEVPFPITCALTVLLLTYLLKLFYLFCDVTKCGNKKNIFV